MFKAIYMHTEPLKHAKNMPILTNYINKNTTFSKCITDLDFCKNFSKTPNLIFCMHVRMDASDSKKYKKL